jgi:hypothetical protein
VLLALAGSIITLVVVIPSLGNEVVGIAEDLRVAMHELHMDLDSGALRNKNLVVSKVAVVSRVSVKERSGRVQTECLLDDLAKIRELRNVVKSGVAIAKSLIQLSARFKKKRRKVRQCTDKLPPSILHALVQLFLASLVVSKVIHSP